MTGEMRNDEKLESRGGRDGNAGDSELPGQPRDHGSDEKDEAVRRRAYDIYLARGGEPGSEVDDWLAAERETRNEGEESFRSDPLAEKDDERR